MPAFVSALKRVDLPTFGKRALDRGVDVGPILRGRFLQHVVAAFGARRRPAYAKAQAPVVVASDSLRDVLQAVVTGNAAALLDPRDAGLEVELVVHDQD